MSLPTSTWTVSYGLLISTVELLGYESVVVSVARRLSFWAFGRIHGDLSVRETFGYACVSGVACAPRLRDYTRHWTPVHLDFVVPEIQSAVVQARNAGARLEGEVRTHNWGRIAVMADPFGHGFCLIEFLGRGYDEIAS